MSQKSHFLAAALIGGVAAWVWKQARLRSHPTPHGEITRWEDEGGTVHSVDESPTASASRSARRKGANGAEEGSGAGAIIGSTPDAWHFPRA